MKKIFYTLAMLLMSISMQAQTTDIKAQSIYDVNQDDKVAISDVTAVVNRLKAPNGSSTEKTVVDTDKLLEVLNALNAKMEVISSLKKEISTLKSSLNQVRSNLGIEYVDPNLLPGKFSVSGTKQVRFTKSNLYWDGSAFKFEENQTDYPTEWNANHVGHFFWTNLTDYQSGNASYMPYAEEYSCSSQSTSDNFWCGEDNPLTVDGTRGLYVLSTEQYSGEWSYLIGKRTNARSLIKYNVTVTSGGTSYNNCVIIAPDDYNGALKSSYTLDELNSDGLVCLPATGFRIGAWCVIDEDVCCWSSSAISSGSDCAWLFMSIGAKNNQEPTCAGRSTGYSIRLVRTVE